MTLNNRYTTKIKEEIEVIHKTLEETDHPEKKSELMNRKLEITDFAFHYDSKKIEKISDARLEFNSFRYSVGSLWGQVGSGIFQKNLEAN